MYTVSQLSGLAGVSVRTLHHYDDIDLLKPSKIGTNGYRYYGDDALLRLQQILFYREIGLELSQIKALLDRPDFELLTALRSHRASLFDRIERLYNLIDTVDETIQHLMGERQMSKKRMFEAFDDETQQQYQREARLQYGPDNVNESIRRWNSYTPEQKQAIGNEGNQIYSDLVALIEAGVTPQDERVQAVLVRWHQHLRYFYEPTLEILHGLGDLYNTDDRFIANFQQLHPDLPDFLQSSITQYVDDLEYAEIVRLLAEDETLRSEK